MASNEGFKAAREYPLWDAIFGRRSRRVAAGTSFRSGALSFQSKLEPQPLSRLEEALLIAATGITGLAFADNPYDPEFYDRYFTDGYSQTAGHAQEWHRDGF